MRAKRPEKEFCAGRHFYFMKNFTYELDENHTLYMTVLSFTYDEITETFPSFRLEGYVLEK